MNAMVAPKDECGSNLFIDLFMGYKVKNKTLSRLKNLKEIISQESTTVFQLEVIDVSKHPQLAEKDKILAVPTLIKQLPPPLRKIIGDLSDKEKVLLGFDLIPLN